MLSDNNMAYGKIKSLYKGCVMAVWRYEKDHTLSKRLLVLSGFFLLLAFVLIVRLFYLQIILGDKYFLMAEKNRISTRLSMPDRGKIYDRNGIVLADNKNTFQAVLIKEQTKDYKKSLERFYKLIPMDDEEKEHIEKIVKYKRAFMPVRIKDNLTDEEMALLHLNAPDLPGVQIEQGKIRFYPEQELHAHTIGYVSLFTDSDAKDKDDPLLNLAGYRIGKTGIEKTLNESLKGVPGALKTEVNAAGRSVQVLDKTPPVAGEDLYLTIDNRLQKYALSALGKHGASAIVMDVNSGEILAMVSAPSFDPSLFLAPISFKNWSKLRDDKRSPLQNKALQGTYSPGSIFKLVVALAGLENKSIKHQTTIDCGGYTNLGNQRFHCWKHEGHGPLDLVGALAASCDVYFYETAQKIGAQDILSTARKLGFGEQTGIEIEGEKQGLVPSFEWKKKKYNDSWRMGDTLNLSIGQGFLNVTPLQIVRAVSAIANDGKLIQPHLLRSTKATIQELNFNPKNLDIVRDGMFQVVNEQGATAYGSRFNLNGMKMAGKTATTQVRRITKEQREKGWKEDDIPWEYRDHALFAAYAPTDKPRYAIVVVVEHGGGGSRVAAPIASKILQEALRLETEDKK